MEEVLLRFPYIGEEIFDRLDEKSLGLCKKVCKSWKKFIEHPNQKFMWIQIIKRYEEKAFLKSFCTIFPLKRFISSQKPKWSKFRLQDLREFVKSLNSEKDKSKLIELFLEKYAELKVELNGTYGFNKETIFHRAPSSGQSNLVNLLMKKSTDFKIDLNAKDRYGYTGFQIACYTFGRKEIVEMMIENAETSKLNLKIKDNHGCTAFQLAEFAGKQGIVDLIKRKLPTGTY